MIIVPKRLVQSIPIMHHKDCSRHLFIFKKIAKVLMHTKRYIIV